MPDRSISIVARTSSALYQGTMAGNSNIEFRDYEPSDKKAVIALVRELQVAEAAYHDRMKPPEQIGGWYIEGLLETCAGNEGRLILALRDGVPVGYAVVLAEVPSSENNPDEIDYTYAFVTDVAVTASLRGQGIGTMLLRACEEHARRHKAKWLRIGVLSKNSGAVRIYENFGFRPLTMELEKLLD